MCYNTIDEQGAIRLTGAETEAAGVLVLALRQQGFVLRP